MAKKQRSRSKTQEDKGISPTYYLGISVVAVVFCVIAASAALWRPNIFPLTPAARAQVGSGAASGLPAGVFDPAELDGLPGIRPSQSAAPAIQERVQELAAQQRSIMDAIPPDFPNVTVPDVPGAAAIPPIDIVAPAPITP